MQPRSSLVTVAKNLCLKTRTTGAAFHPRKLVTTASASRSQPIIDFSPRRPLAPSRTSLHDNSGSVRYEIVRSFSSAAVIPWNAPSNVQNRAVTIIGAGVLGRRIAVLWASTGRPVTLHDTDPTQLSEAIAYIGDTLTNYCSENGTHPGHLRHTMDFHDAVKDSWMVIEAIPERLSAKIALLGRLDRILPQDCIIATNSSSYRSSELIGDVKCKERVLNTHYYVPPRNTYVELMSCGQTAPAVFPFLAQNMESVGLHPIIVPKESTGMIFNRIWGATKRETLRVLEEGLARPDDVDALFKDFFHAEKGPCAKMDEVGLDTVALVEKHYLDSRPELSKAHLEWLEEKYVRGWALGDKTGSGLYTAAEKAQINATTVGDGFKDEKAGARATGGQ